LWQHCDSLSGEGHQAYLAIRQINTLEQDPVK
jgi:hypothetical protein